jgi:hypothetical protein
MPHQRKRPLAEINYPAILPIFTVHITLIVIGITITIWGNRRAELCKSAVVSETQTTFGFFGLIQYSANSWLHMICMIRMIAGFRMGRSKPAML